MPTPAIAACTGIAGANVTDRALRTRGGESLRSISGFALTRRAPNGRPSERPASIFRVAACEVHNDPNGTSRSRRPPDGWRNRDGTPLPTSPRGLYARSLHAWPGVRSKHGATPRSWKLIAAIQRREFVPRDPSDGNRALTVYAAMADVGFAYYSRRERQGTSGEQFPAVRSGRGRACDERAM